MDSECIEAVYAALFPDVLRGAGDPPKVRSHQGEAVFVNRNRFDNGQRLMDYDVGSRVLTCPLGAPLPSPYDFLATRCTGFLPIKQSGMLRYSGVASGVASKIWRALYGRS